MPKPEIRTGRLCARFIRVSTFDTRQAYLPVVNRNGHRSVGQGCIHSDLIRGFRFEIPSPATILTPCRYTSFIAGSADGTARYLSVHGIGRERHAPTVVRPGSIRSCPSLPPAVAPTRPRPVMAS